MSSLSILATVLSLVAFGPYAWNIVYGTGRPKEASWLVFLWIDIVWVVPILYRGQIEPVVYLIGAWAIGNTTNFVLARYKGSDKGWSRTDMVCFSIGVVAAVFGYALSSPTIAIIGGI